MTAEVLLISLLVLFAINTPIAIAIGVASVLGIVVQGDFNPMMLVQRMFGGTDSFHLMAVPLFMFTGTIMEAGGISRRIIDFADALVGWLPGGMAAVTIVSAMFFAGISGSAAADAAAVGAILIPAMKKTGYESDFAAAVLASGGSIGVIIPPSIPMIIFGFLTGASIGQLFAAGILPGLLIGMSLIAVATFISWKRGYRATTRFSPSRVWQTFKAAILALGAPLIILGGILFGIFTATESAAVAVVYGLAVGMIVYRKIGVKDLFPLFRDGAITASIVMLIIATASAFSWIAAIEEIPARLAGGLLGLTTHPVTLLVLINLVLLVAGTFVETTAALILLVPHDHGDAALPWHRRGSVGCDRRHQSGHRHVDTTHGHLPDRLLQHIRRQPGGHQQTRAAIHGHPHRRFADHHLLFSHYHVDGKLDHPTIKETP